MKNTFRLVGHALCLLFCYSILSISTAFASVDNYAAYLFAYFKGEGLAQGEQIYFAVSKDGLHWTDLNSGNPVLTSSLGEKGLRDPFIMRSAEGDRFFVIATDLKINGNGNWTAAQTTGSKSIMVWESPDLINWSEQRMCRVAPEGAGCTWAPEAIYDDASGQYLVFWSSKIPSGDNTHRVYYCTTKDFVTFSEAKVWIELKNGGGRAISVIDATAIKVGDTYYRFKKNEATEAHKNGMPTTGKYIIMEKSNSLLGNWTEVNSDMSKISYVEGPTCFKFNNEEKWCLLLDDFGGKGYYPLVTDDLSSGRFTQLPASEYAFPSVMRHGSVISLTADEYYGLLAKYDPSVMTTACINPGSKQQKLEGWGVSLCWWAHMCGRWREDKVDQLVKLLTDEDGLNFNIFRYNIGGGDDPSHYNGHMCNGKGKRAEMEGFKASANAPYDWTKDAGQLKVLDKLNKARKDAVFEAFSNSAPYWMTYSGCASGNANAGKDNLKPENYGIFSDYLIEVCKHIKSTYGIEFKTLDPFNEPNTNYWGANGGQEGCHFDPASQVNLIKVLYPKLKASGLNTVISACDETSVQTAIGELQLYQKENILNMLGQYNVHTYGGNARDKANLRSLIHETEIPFWMSETGAGGTGLNGNLNMAQRMFDDLNYLMPQAWVDWQFVEENNDQWCLVQGNFASQEFHVVKNMYVRMQVTRFIKQGYTFLTIGRDDLLAAISPEGDKLVVVMLNTGSDQKRVSLDLSLFKEVAPDVKLYTTNSKYNCQLLPCDGVENKRFSYTMGGEEISTAIFDVTADRGIEGIQPEKAYVIVPRSATSVISAEAAEGLKLANIFPQDTLQRWYFQPLSNGNYTIYTKRGGERMAVTDDGSYFLKLEKMVDGKSNQQFKLNDLGENCYAIVSVGNGKSFDLEGEKSTAGTNIGVWAAGNPGANAHREWRIVPYPFANALPSDETAMLEQPSNGLTVLGEDNMLRIVNELDDSQVNVWVVDMNGLTIVDRTFTISNELELPIQSGVYVVVTSMGGVQNAQRVIVR